jgi:hypothetical protein
MIRQDYIKRLIEELGAAVARALGRNDAAANDEAMQQVERAYGELGVGRGFLDLEAASLRAIIGTADRARAVAEVCRLEAAVLEARGDATRAAQRRRLADDLSSR